MEGATEKTLEKQVPSTGIPESTGFSGCHHCRNPNAYRNLRKANLEFFITS